MLHESYEQIEAFLSYIQIYMITRDLCSIHKNASSKKQIEGKGYHKQDLFYI